MWSRNTSYIGSVCTRRSVKEKKRHWNFSWNFSLCLLGKYMSFLFLEAIFWLLSQYMRPSPSSFGCLASLFKCPAIHPHSPHVHRPAGWLPWGIINKIFGRFIQFHVCREAEKIAPTIFSVKCADIAGKALFCAYSSILAKKLCSEEEKKCEI